MRRIVAIAASLLLCTALAMPDAHARKPRPDETAGEVPPTDLTQVEFVPMGAPIAGQPLTVNFSGEIVPAPMHSVWFVVAEEKADESTYLTSVLIPSGANSVAIPMPSEAGRFEVRLVVFDATGKVVDVPFRKAAEVAPAPPPTDPGKLTISLVSNSVAKGDPVVLRFSEPLRAADGERYWMTVCTPETPDASWDAWVYVDDGATEVQVVPTRTGALEVRLHGNYPTKSYNVIFRKGITVAAE